MTGEASGPPRVWLLLGDKGGDNAQLRVLAGALGWPSEEKPLLFNRGYQVPNLLLGATLATLDPACPPPAPPWPDLILASGRRAVPVARWIRRQSGGRTRLVHVGRTWAPLTWFDLVVAMPQYRVARAANVMRAHLPLNRLAPQRLAGEAAAWQARVAHLPRPFTTVLLGGPARPLRFTPAEAASIGHEVEPLARRLGGSVLAVGGRRTAPGAVDAFAAALAVPHLVHDPQRDPTQNPYAAFIGLADRIVVSADSASMLAEACRTGKPVIVAPLPYERTPRVRLMRAIERALPDAARDLLQRFGIAVFTRDMRRLVRVLAAEGHIAPFDAPQRPTQPPPDDLPAIVERVRILVEKDRGL